MSTTLVAGLALISRIIFLSAVPILEYMLPHVPSDQFWAPVWLANQDSVGLGTKMFFGLGNWDSQHFIHIAHSGYTFQTDLPFFPMYPALVGMTAKGLEWFGMNILSALVLTATALNVFFFVWSAVALYQLTMSIFRDDNFAMMTVALYCISPATVFFMAFYSEPLYALCTFKGLQAHHPFKPAKSVLWFAAACLTRSNGIVNAGFILHYFFSLVSVHIFYNIHAGAFIPKMIQIARLVVTALALTFIMLVPFGTFQFLSHKILCSNPPYISTALLNHSFTYDIPVLSGKADYCETSGKFLLPYVWVQDKFWNVGFLKYWTVEQIPNFLIALPAVIIITSFCIPFIYRNRALIVIPYAVYNNVWIPEDDFPPLLFVHAVHALFLVVSSLFFINVQVITRLIASSSPLFYWIAARHVTAEGSAPVPAALIFDFFSMNRSNITFSGLLIYRYFIGYAVLGLILFTNGFPWT